MGLFNWLTTFVEYFVESHRRTGGSVLIRMDMDSISL
jgi:hypothetical protein